MVNIRKLKHTNFNIQPINFCLIWFLWKTPGFSSQTSLKEELWNEAAPKVNASQCNSLKRKPGPLDFNIFNFTFWTHIKNGKSNFSLIWISHKFVDFSAICNLLNIYVSSQILKRQLFWHPFSRDKNYP